MTTTYRNDHEAALARVDALELELATLRERRPAPAPTPVRTRRATWPLFAASLTALSLGVFGGVMLAVANPQVPAPAPASGGSPVDRGTLVACANRIEAAQLLGADLTDPHAASPRPITSIATTAAPCRDELHTVIEVAPLSADERAALWKWAAQEDELAGAISRIEVYYASDPYQLDNYATAKQLWIEYDRTYYARNHAISAWRERFAKI